MADVRKHVREFVEAAEATVEGMTAAELAEAIDRGRVSVIDVRRGEERREHGAIPGAAPVPRGGIEFAADPESEYYDPVFDAEGRFVCHCSGGSRGALAAATLHEMGYPDVAYLEGGFTAWADAGYEVEAVGTG